MKCEFCMKPLNGNTATEWESAGITVQTAAKYRYVLRIKATGDDGICCSTCLDNLRRIQDT